jgi:heme exporter protein A
MKESTSSKLEPHPPTGREEVAVVVEGLTKNFGYFPALRGVDLKLLQGKFLTIVGPNGAGKTTLLRILATLAKPSSGQARLLGLDLRRDGLEIRRIIGVVLHQTLLYPELTAEQNLRFYGRLHGVAHLEDRLQEIAQAVGLAHRLKDPVRTFSRGMQQRLAIARAILHQPSIMLLDEPDTGLDLEAAAQLKAILRGDGSQSRTVLMTTHNLERGLQICDQVAIMNRGRIVYQSEGKIDPKDFPELYCQYTGLGE